MTIFDDIEKMNDWYASIQEVAARFTNGPLADAERIAANTFAPAERMTADLLAGIDQMNAWMGLPPPMLSSIKRVPSAYTTAPSPIPTLAIRRGQGASQMAVAYDAAFHRLYFTHQHKSLKEAFLDLLEREKIEIKGESDRQDRYYAFKKAMAERRKWQITRPIVT